MDRAEVRKIVLETVADELGIPEEQVTDESRLMEDLNADSLDLLEIIMDLEKKFNYNIPDDDVEGLTTIKAVIAYLQGKII